MQPLPLTLTSSPQDPRLEAEESDDEVDMPPKSPKLLITQETQTSIEQYHPTPDKLKVRKTRHRRTSSQGSYNNFPSPRSPRLSPMRERRASSSRRKSSSYVNDHDSYDDGQAAFPAFLFQKQQSTSSINGHLTPTSPEDIVIRRMSSSSSSSSTSDEVCQINVDDDPDNDILETLDRKVSEVINRSRFNSSPSVLTETNPVFTGPYSRLSPGAARRASGLVRFGDDEDDDKVGGHLTDDSSADDHPVKWSDDEEARKPSDPVSPGFNNFGIQRKR